MRPIVFTLFLAACAPEGADVSALATDGPLPPGLAPALEVSPAISGAEVTLVVTNVPPGANVYFLLSTRGAGAGPCHPTFGDCAGIRDRIVQLARRPADANGQRSVTRRVPPTFDDRSIWFQAFVENGVASGVSNVVERLIGDDDLDLVYDDRDNCLDVFNPAPQWDIDGDGFGEACDCDDGDGAINPDALDDTTDGIDQNCDGYDGIFVDYQGSYVGPGNYTSVVFGLPQPCLGDFVLDVDYLASPQIEGTFECTADTLVGTLTIPWLVRGSIDLSSGIVSGVIDDQGGTVLDWSGGFLGVAPDRELTGTGQGTITGGPFPQDYFIDFTAEEVGAP